MHEKLSSIIETLKLTGSMMNQQMLVELYDETATLVFQDATLGASEKVSVGCQAEEDLDWIQGVIGTGEVANRTSEDEEGRPLQITYVPVFDAFVIGVIVTTTYVKTNELAMQKAETFMNSIDQINNAIDMMSIHFENLFDKLQGMKEQTGTISKNVEETSSVVSKIRANASKSKILALNASIEAARSGEAGRGFTVVAKEMGEMASASGTSASEINTALQAIFGTLEEITVSITDANQLAEKQTGSITEIETYLGEALQAAMELGEALMSE